MKYFVFFMKNAIIVNNRFIKVALAMFTKDALDLSAKLQNPELTCYSCAGGGRRVALGALLRENSCGCVVLSTQSWQKLLYLSLNRRWQGLNLGDLGSLWQ